MGAEHIEFLVEEPSAEEFLRNLLARFIPATTTYDVHAFSGKSDLLRSLEPRLLGYSFWLPQSWRIVVLIDRDDDDCLELKATLEAAAARAGFASRTTSGGTHWQLVNRIPIEELEAWYFGDWAAVGQAFPRVPAEIPAKAPYRDPDAVRGGTWEAFERILQRSGYHLGGLRKIEAAREVARWLDPPINRSQSFRVFWAAVEEAVA